MAGINRTTASVSKLNSTRDTLDAAGTWSGEWEISDQPQFGLSIVSDADGELTVEFGIPLSDDTVITVFSKSVSVYAGDSGRFVPFVLGPARAVRLSYVNGDTAQTEFALVSMFGNGLTNITAGTEGERLVVQPEAVWCKTVAIIASDLVGSVFRMLVDKSDTTNYPHLYDNWVSIASEYIRVRRSATSATGGIAIYVVAAIDGTSATLQPVSYLGFEKGDDLQPRSDRPFSPARTSAKVEGGETPDFLSDGILTTARTVTDGGATGSIPALTSDTTLTGPNGLTGTADVGDLVALFEYTGSGSYNGTIRIDYFTQR